MEMCTSKIYWEVNVYYRRTVARRIHYTCRFRICDAIMNTGVCDFALFPHPFIREILLLCNLLHLAVIIPSSVSAEELSANL